MKITTKSLLDQGTKPTANTTHVLESLVLSKHGVKGWITEKMEFRAVEEPSNEPLDIYVVYVRNSVKMWTYTEKEFSKNFNEIYISKTTKVSNVSHFQKKKRYCIDWKNRKRFSNQYVSFLKPIIRQANSGYFVCNNKTMKQLFLQIPNLCKRFVLGLFSMML